MFNYVRNWAEVKELIDAGTVSSLYVDDEVEPYSVVLRVYKGSGKWPFQYSVAGPYATRTEAQQALKYARGVRDGSIPV